MQAPTPAQSFIPRIWAETIKASIERGMVICTDHAQGSPAEHLRRLNDDPAYARFWAGRATGSYWDALYENWCPEEEEDDEW